MHRRKNQLDRAGAAQCMGEVALEADNRQSRQIIAEDFAHRRVLGSIVVRCARRMGGHQVYLRRGQSPASQRRCDGAGGSLALRMRLGQMVRIG